MDSKAKRIVSSLYTRLLEEWLKELSVFSLETRILRGDILKNCKEGIDLLCFIF